jgi:hypothetical protein
MEHKKSKKRQHLIVGIAIVVSCLGCATLESDSEISSYGPNTPGTAKSGRVSYNPNGLEEIVEARRNSALKKIYKFCGNSNEYKLTDEKTQSKDALNGDSLAVAGANEVRVISFTCTKSK